MKTIVELAKDHNGDMNKAKEMISNVASKGVYAVKFQSYDLKDLVKKHKNYTRNKKCHLTIDQLKELKDYAELQGVKFWCSAFSESVLKPLREFTDTIKIPSTYFSHMSFVRKCIDIFPNVHISTGMHDRGYIEELVGEYRRYNIVTTTPKLLSYYKSKITFYHCVSEYPVKSGMSLNRIKYLNMKGLSYHGYDINVILMAHVLGVEYAEVHYSQWASSLIRLNNNKAKVIECMFDSGNASEEERKNYKFYKKEFHGLSKA